MYLRRYRDTQRQREREREGSRNERRREGERAEESASHFNWLLRHDESEKFRCNLN